MGVNMSDSLYKPDDRSKIRPKCKGVLQFGASTLSRDYKGIEVPEKDEKVAGPIGLSYSSFSDADYLHKIFSMDNQLSRVTHPDKSIIPTSNVRDKDAWMQMNETLPGHMHNQGKRFSVSYHHEKNLRALRTHEADFAQLKSTLNDKKLFRINPETGQPYGKPVKHKKSKYLFVILTNV